MRASLHHLNMMLFFPYLVQIAQQSQPHFEHHILIEFHDGLTSLEMGLPSLKVESPHHFSPQSLRIIQIGHFKLREVSIKPPEEYFGPNPSLNTVGNPAFFVKESI